MCTYFRELELARHGLKLLKRSPSSFTPCLDGRYLLLGPDKELNHSEISKFSKNDADAYPRYSISSIHITITFLVFMIIEVTFPDEIMITLLDRSNWLVKFLVKTGIFWMK